MGTQPPVSQDPAVRELPMFPLSRVLFCGESLPLHVFEPRYQELTRRCLEGDRRFGVVLIMRGAEVGADANQERCDIGTVAEIVAAQQLDDGRWMLQSRGVERLRVLRWLLPDDPYPSAVVDRWSDPPSAAVETDGPLGAVTAAYDRILALLRAARRGGAAGEVPVLRLDQLSSDPVRASYQLSSVAPVGELDRQRLLAAAGTGERLRLLAEMLEDFEQTLRLIGGAGNPHPPE